MKLNKEIYRLEVRVSLVSLSLEWPVIESDDCSYGQQLQKAAFDKNRQDIDDENTDKLTQSINYRINWCSSCSYRLWLSAGERKSSHTRARRETLLAIARRRIPVADTRGRWLRGRRTCRWLQRRRSVIWLSPTGRRQYNRL